MPVYAARPGGDAELVVDRRDVLDDDLLGDREARGDRAVAAALGHHRQHLALARRQPGERVAGPVAVPTSAIRCLSR
jgi:hypothetical protein